MCVLPSASPIKTSAGFWNIDKPIQKFIWRDKIARIANIILKDKNKIGQPTLPDYCKT